MLHIFAPDYKIRFGGQNITWKYNFSKWNDPEVEPYVLDTESHRLVAAKEAFNFDYPDVQKSASRWERALWFFPLMMNLIRYRKEYDILHLHVLWWASLLIGPWTKWKKIPVIYESVLLDADTPGGILQGRFGKIQVWLMKSYMSILAISQYLAEDYLKCGFSPSRVFTLMNSVDDTLFVPVPTTEEKESLRRKLNIPGNAFVLLFVGIVGERKGVDILIRAFFEAASKRPELYLLIAGPKTRREIPSSDEDFVNDVYSFLNQHTLLDRVRFTGLIQDRQRLAEIFRASDIFVFPSKKEGLGNVVLEAMASGLPVVVSQLPVLDNIIKHEENGLVVPIGDGDALRDSIVVLKDDRSLAEKIGYNARHYIEKNLSPIQWQKQLVHIYDGLLSSP